ncbi:MAG: galactose-1-phosphate uridylyltransferase [Phycisphaeraceae bacterium]
MTPNPADSRWEQRWHPLRREWVVIAAHRDDRPWSGQREVAVDERPPTHAPACHLCPGNTRVSGAVNDAYTGVYVFDNDHPCVGPGAPVDLVQPGGPYAASPATGLSRVVCYHRRHDLRLAQLDHAGVVRLLATWQEQYRELGSRPEVNHVLIFENNGPQVGVSNPHPHCQIYATTFVFPTIEREAAACAAHHERTGRSLLGDMIDAELADGRRILAARPGAVSFVPYCARYACETYVAPRRAVASVAELHAAELDDLAAALKDTLTRYDNLWSMPLPYVMALHQAPTDGRDDAGFHFHIELHPPLRRPNLLKFLAGPEIGAGGFIADTWPEDKAAELRAVAGDVHYLDAAMSEASDA